jgi:hypothetical protein
MLFAPACICAALLAMPSIILAQETVSLSSQAELARAADSVRKAYRSSQAELAREADSVRSAYRSSQARLAREADSIRKAYRDSLDHSKSGSNGQATSKGSESPAASSGATTNTVSSQSLPELPLHFAEQSPRFIRGYASIPWGTWPAEIIRKKGKPGTRREESDAIYLAYEDSLVGTVASALYLVSKTEGLVKGIYSLDYGLGQGCETVFNELVDGIKAKYPEIESTESRYNSTSLDFCSGVMIGYAGRTVSWYDPGNDRAVIRVALMPGAQKIRVHYESPAFSSWSEDHKKSVNPF